MGIFGPKYLNNQLQCSFQNISLNQASIVASAAANTAPAAFATAALVFAAWVAFATSAAFAALATFAAS